MSFVPLFLAKSSKRAAESSSDEGPSGRKVARSTSPIAGPSGIRRPVIYSSTSSTSSSSTSSGSSSSSSSSTSSSSSNEDDEVTRMSCVLIYSCVILFLHNREASYFSFAIYDLSYTQDLKYTFAIFDFNNRPAFT